MVRSFIAVASAAVFVSAVAAQQQANIGFKPLTLSQPFYTFDTAEQPRIRVTPVVRGLPHPFSLAFLHVHKFIWLVVVNDVHDMQLCASRLGQKTRLS